MKKRRFYRVIADEVTDPANEEQLSLVIRYFDPDSKTIAQRLPEFSACHLGISGQAIAEKILGLLQKNGLDPALLRGQGYDGARNMAGKKFKEQLLLSPPNIHFLSTFIAPLTSSI